MRREHFFSLLAPFEDFSDLVVDLALSRHFEFNSKNCFKAKFLADSEANLQCATSSTAKKTLCSATSPHFYTLCTFPIHIDILMLINSYLNNFTMPCTRNGNEKANAMRWQSRFPPRGSSVTTSCCLSLRDGAQPPPAHSQPASKPLHRSPPCFCIWTASKQLVALPMEKQPYWNTDNVYIHGLNVLSQLPDIILEQSKI